MPAPRRADRVRGGDANNALDQRERMATFLRASHGRRELPEPASVNARPRNARAKSALALRATPPARSFASGSLSPRGGERTSVPFLAVGGSHDRFAASTGGACGHD